MLGNVIADIFYFETDRFGGKQYGFSRDRIYLDSGNTACSRDGATMLTMDSGEEASFINDIMDRQHMTG